MRKILIILLILQASKAFSFEIQCQSAWDDILVVLRTSPETQRTYLLFLNDTEVEKYWFLNSDNISNSSDTFVYQDTETRITLDKINSVGKISSESSIFRDKEIIPLVKCTQF